MANNKINEEEIELATIDILKDIGYKYVHGEEIAPDSENPERTK